MRRVVIVGAGISGLSLAHALRRRSAERGLPIEVEILEQSDRAGGSIRSERLSGYLCEWGPNGFLDNVPETLELVRELGIEDRIQVSDDAARRRFIFRRGALRGVPEGALSFLASDILSCRGKLRLLAEPLVPAGASEEESIHSFAKRRIGREAAEVLVDSMVSGIFAGDSRELSLRACFPKMHKMESEHGGLFRAMLAMRKRKKKGEGLDSLRPVPAGAPDRGDAAGVARAAAAAAGGAASGQAGASAGKHAGGGPAGAPRAAERGRPTGPGGRLTSFREGMEEIIRALLRDLEGAVRTGSRVVTLEEKAARGKSSEESGEPSAGADERADGDIRAEAGRRAAADRRPQAAGAAVSAPAPRAFRAEVEGASPVDADAVVLAGPAVESARLLRSVDPELASALGEIRSAPIAVICLGYDQGRLPRPLDGFGFLIPRGEGPRILGVLWDSSIYPGRAPAGKVLMRVMAGGAHDPEAAGLPDGDLLDLVRRDLSATMRLDLAPEFTRIFRHPAGIPQYKLGHLRRLERAEERLDHHPGLFLAGNSYRGVSMNSCIAESGPLADRVLRFLGKGG